MSAKSKKSKNIRFASGDIAKNIMEDNVRHSGVHVKPSGPIGDQMRAPEDYAPVSMDIGDPALNEAMRDEISMVQGGLYGPGALGGVRTQNEKLPAYLKQLRARDVTDKYYDLMMTAFDPLDPNQRQLLERYVPGYTESKISFFESCQEQISFIFRVSITPFISREEHQRCVRILGGAERLLKHPFIEGILGEQEVVMQGLSALFIRTLTGMNQLPGLFSFFTGRDGQNGADRKADDPLELTGNRALAASRGAREYYAKLMLRHFPRYMTGSYDVFAQNDPIARRKAQQAASALVDRCEAVCRSLEPLGNVATRFLPQVNARGINNRANILNMANVQGAFTQ